jgi:hypothetical protein
MLHKHKSESRYRDPDHYIAKQQKTKKGFPAKDLYTSPDIIYFIRPVLPGFP